MKYRLSMLQACYEWCVLSLIITKVFLEVVRLHIRPDNNANKKQKKKKKKKNEKKKNVDT